MKESSHNDKATGWCKVDTNKYVQTEERAQKSASGRAGQRTLVCGAETPPKASMGFVPCPHRGKRRWAGSRAEVPLSPHLPSGRIFPDLSSNDMLLFIVKGINLPTPPGEGAPGRGQGCGDHLSAQP